MSDLPRLNKSFNPMAYRSMTAYNAHLASLREDQAKEQDSSRSQQSHPTTQQSTGTSGAQSSHPQQNNTSKNSTSKKEKEVESDPPHYMSDAEVKQWYIDANREYEERKKAGYNKDYVPAGGHPSDLLSRTFNKEHRGAKPIKGLASSMHAPKTQEQKAGQSSEKADTDRSGAPSKTGGW